MGRTLLKSSKTISWSVSWALNMMAMNVNSRLLKEMKLSSLATKSTVTRDFMSTIHHMIFKGDKIRLILVLLPILWSLAARTKTYQTPILTGMEGSSKSSMPSLFTQDPNHTQQNQRSWSSYGYVGLAGTWKSTIRKDGRHADCPE
jgi:hypothetical protein